MDSWDCLYLSYWAVLIVDSGVTRNVINNDCRFDVLMYGILLARLMLLRQTIRRVEKDDWRDVFQRVLSSCDSRAYTQSF